MKGSSRNNLEFYGNKVVRILPNIQRCFTWKSSFGLTATVVALVTRSINSPSAWPAL